LYVIHRWRNGIYAETDGSDWYMENITTLCTATCKTSLMGWLSNVESVCTADTVIQSGVEVQAKAMALQFSFNYDLACMQDR